MLTLRDVLLVLHIAGAGTWLGANVVQAIVPPLAARTGAATLSSWYRVTAGLSTRLYMPAAILILVTGILMVLDSDVYGFGDVFVNIGFGMIVIGAVLGIVIFGPGGEKAAAALESGDEREIRTEVGKVTRWGVIDTVLFLFTITAMVLRLD
jgi:hypothetical protein